MRKLFLIQLNWLLFVVSFILITFGCWLIHPAAAYISAGLIGALMWADINRG